MKQTTTNSPSSEGIERQQMHEVYLQGGRESGKAPHVVYQSADCPHADCDQHMQAIDFRLEAHGRDVHDVLVTAWWADTGFAGRCPKCNGWIHFTVGGKNSIDDKEAASLPQLPAGWFDEATVL